MSKEELSSSELVRFINKVNKLEPIYFAGVAKMLKVELKVNETEMRPFEDVLSDMIDEYITLNRRQRRNLEKIMKNVR